MFERLFAHWPPLSGLFLILLPMVGLMAVAFVLFVLRVLETWRTPPEETLADVLARAQMEAATWPPPPVTTGRDGMDRADSDEL